MGDSKHYFSGVDPFELSKTEGLLGHIHESAAAAVYKKLTVEKMMDVIEKMKIEYIYGTPGNPYSMEGSFHRFQVRPGIEVRKEDIPYDMEPEDYIEKIAKKIDEECMGMSPTPFTIPAVVRIDPSTGEIINC